MRKWALKSFAVAGMSLLVVFLAGTAASAKAVPTTQSGYSSESGWDDHRDKGSRGHGRDDRNGRHACSHNTYNVQDTDLLSGLEVIVDLIDIILLGSGGDNGGGGNNGGQTFVCSVSD